MSSIISVAVGVIENKNQEILLAQRKEGVHQAGKWEFVGGKVEKGETSRHALTRELQEELGIDVIRAQPLIRIHHTYPEYQVVLDVWRVLEYRNTPRGKENQAIQWVSISHLHEYDFPAANQAIIKAIQLPSHYVITPPDFNKNTAEVFIRNMAQKNYSLLRFRAQGISEKEYLAMIPLLCELCQRFNIQLMLDGEPTLLEKYSVAGLHLSSTQMQRYTERPISKEYLLGVSCHNEKELEKAARLEADFAVLAPVFPTPSHPDVTVLGWPAFSSLVEKANFPVYAMGGMQDKSEAIWFGAQGVAGLRMFAA